jgi:hypothetical protein
MTAPRMERFAQCRVTFRNMLGPPSIALRVVRSLTALITMWCLGCSSYGPMLSALVGSVGSAGMACDGSSGMEDATSKAPSASTDASWTASVPASAEGWQHSISCSCQSCHATSPAAIGLATAPLSPPRPSPSSVVNFLSVDREPLVPPPNAVSHRA